MELLIDRLKLLIIIQFQELIIKSILCMKTDNCIIFVIYQNMTYYLKLPYWPDILLSFLYNAFLAGLTAVFKRFIAHCFTSLVKGRQIVETMLQRK